MDQEYLNRLNQQNHFNLVIMGKDPFPTNPTGIPFCKSTWREQLSQNSSGYHVLNSIGINFDGIEIRFDRPRDLFMVLAENGIAFLNLSYQLIGGKIRKHKHRTPIQTAFRLNLPILNNSTTIILCGEASKNRWNHYIHENILYFVHPDPRNSVSANQLVRDNWWRTWEVNALRNLVNINVESLQRAH